MTLQIKMEIRVRAIDVNRLTNLTRQLMRHTNDTARKFRDDRRVYPPPTPLQRRGKGYRRTYALRRGWKVDPARITGNAIIAKVYNDVPYAKRVVGGDRGEDQARFHSQPGRWTKMRDAALRTNFEVGVQRIVRASLQNVTIIRRVIP